MNESNAPTASVAPATPATQAVPQALEAVIFDMDGLMIDSESIWTAAWEPTLAEFGIHEIPEGLPDACRGTAGPTQVAQIEKYLGTAVDAAAISQRLEEIGEKNVIEQATKKPGLDELLAYLRQMRVPLAVASSATLERIDVQLDRLGLTSYFAERVSGHDLAHPKPAPDVFLLAAKRLGAAPHASMVLEDSLAGIAAAHAGGFMPVMVPDLVAPTSVARAQAYVICHDLLEVKALIAERWG
ncbi:MAG: HAD family hydrolase [Atopobiaceae bacterium]|jgi:HAD superfamily hydrolase (TIGR01509 family)